MKKLTLEEFIVKAKSIYEDNFDYSDTEYVNTVTPVDIRCIKHNLLISITPKSHLAGTGCKLCTKEKRLSDMNEYLNYVNKKHKNFYDYSRIIYSGFNNKIEIGCPIHGWFWQLAGAHHAGKGCQKCAKVNNRKDKSTFIKEANEEHFDSYDYSLVEYVNSHTKIKIICDEHGIFEQTPLKHLAGRGCPKCKKSKGEKLILRFLTDNNIKYEVEKSFGDLKNNKYGKLRFNFYLPEYDLLIEFDGQQHFEPVRINGISEELALKRHIDTKTNDFIKNKYAVDNEIRLLRIPYYEIKEIYNILTKELLSDNSAITKGNNNPRQA